MMSSLNMKRKILIVEDDVIIALHLRAMLESIGNIVIGPALNDEQCMKIMKKEKADAVFMDIQLKNSKDGIELTKMIQETGNTPVIYLTANSDKATKQRAEEVGCFAYLTKPVDLKTLHAILETLPLNA